MTRCRVWLALLVLGGCKRSTSVTAPDPIRPIVTELRGASAKACLDRIEATGRVSVAIGGTASKGERALKLRVEAEQDGDAAWVRARLEDFTGVARPIAQNGQGKGALEAVVSALCADLGARVRVAYGTDAEVIAALKSTHDVERDEAIVTAGERQLAAALPVLVPLLKQDDEDLRDLVIGALRDLKDPRAVKPLTEISRFGDVDALPKIFDALAAIGGPEARAYLDFVASNHPHPETKALAKRALDKIDHAPAAIAPPPAGR